MSKLQPPPEGTVSYYRSLALICRQQAARRPDESWNWLSEAERFEHLASQGGTLGVEAGGGVSSDKGQTKTSLQRS
jgi:hypothetical protein